MAQVSLEQKVDKLADSVAEISEVLAHVVSNMATKDDVAQLREEMSAMATVMATKEDVRTMVDRAKEEIMDVVRPVEKAVDGDAVTIVGHEKRIVRIEKHLELTPITI